MITGAQIREARELLQWTPWYLAQVARVRLSAVQRAEASEGESAIAPTHREAIQRVLEEARKVIPTFLERADKPDRGGATV